MKKFVCILMAMCIVFTLAACGAKQTEPEVKEWNRQGYFMDENENLLSVIWMEDIDEPGWYVGLMIGELMAGWTIPQEGNTLHGNLNAWDETAEPLIVTVSEEGEDGLLLTVEGGENYHFVPYDVPEATIVVTVNTEGWGYIAYVEGEERPEIDPEFPAQSAYIGLAEPATHTFVAQAQAGNLFVKWTKNGKDFSTEPVITLLLDESAEYIAVFEEDPDWQNPVMNFIGSYQCDRARATVECSGFDEAWISIEWANSVSEMTNWVIFGQLDTEKRSVSYEGCSKTNFVYDESGEVVSDDGEYEDIPGVITFNDDGTFTWHRDLPEGGADMVFEWVPVNPGRLDGERFEAVIILEGMEETVQYEHIINETLGFEMDYDYESFVRRSESDRERFSSIYDDQSHPDNYLDVAYSAEDADTVAAGIKENLSQKYDLLEESRELNRAGSCIYIEASELKGTGTTANQLQAVYIIPAPHGCFVATANFAFEAAEGFGHRFSYMMHTFSVL